MGDIAYYWVIISFVFGCFVAWCAISARIPDEELTREELMDAVGRIMQVCEGDQRKQWGMLKELEVWMDYKSDVKTCSKELLEIIEGVRNTTYGKQ